MYFFLNSIPIGFLFWKLYYVTKIESVSLETRVILSSFVYFFQWRHWCDFIYDNRSEYNNCKLLSFLFLKKSCNLCKKWRQASQIVRCCLHSGSRVWGVSTVLLECCGCEVGWGTFHTRARWSAIAVTRTSPLCPRPVTTAQKFWRGDYVSPVCPLISQQSWWRGIRNW